MNALLLLAALFAAERIEIWPVGKMPHAQDHQIAAMTDETAAPGFKADAHRIAYLEWGKQPAESVRNGACMMLISGGSYCNCCDVGLVRSWEEKLTALGYQCVNFVYRTPRPKGLPIYQSAWEDGQRAVRLVRREAAKRGFDPERIGAISMSAGSHLNILLATSSLTPAYERIDEIDDLPCHLNIAIANAPAYATTDASVAGTPATRDGNAVDVSIDPSFRFDAKTCPICLCHGAADIYSPNGSTLIYRELRKRKIPAEVHLYADKDHGAYGFDRAVEFLRQMNFDGKLGAEADCRIYTGNNTAQCVREELWPTGKMPDVQTNQTYAPYLEWYLPKTISTKAIQVVLPGGGYYDCNVKGEGFPVAEYFNGRGMTVVIVKYRTPRPLGGLAKHITAWQDAQRAIRLVRKGAAARGLDPNRIGVMGFSAGGHLTLMCATSARSLSYLPVDETDSLSCKVQWAFPIYPAYSLTDGGDCPNVSGGNEDDAIPVREFAFDLDTPVMCFMHGDADGWAAMNSVKCWEKLRRMGLQSDLHTLAKRGHCFQFKSAPETGSRTWADRLWEFLTRKGLNK